MHVILNSLSEYDLIMQRELGLIYGERDSRIFVVREIREFVLYLVVYSVRNKLRDIQPDLAKNFFLHEHQSNCIMALDFL